MIRHCALVLALAGAGLGTPLAAGAGDLAPLQPGLDYHSFANIEQFRVTRLELDLRVEPAEKVLYGVVGLQVKRLDPGATELILDTRDITVTEVTQKAQEVLGALSKDETTWVGRPFHFEKKDPVLGQALVIELPPSKRPNEFIRIEYETSPPAPALQWLSAQQTKHKPFMYTQSSPIGARSWIPLQDTPQVRMTYKAFIHTSPDVLAVMSAKSNADGQGHPLKHNGQYAFVMTDPVPSYQIALAVGDLKFQETGPRSGVYADKGMLKEAAREFADTETMIQAGEKLLGPYRWERYDIAVMPPSFPAAAAANPRLAFLSPTAIAGDRSLLSIAARAVAHAWSGNLVTNATWRDLWLNEGFSAYVASRIMAATYGEPSDAMERVRSVRELRREMAALAPADQALAIDLRDRDPYDAFSAVPAGKGRLFLTYLEVKFGRERFDAFLRAYVDHFAFQSVTTEQFVKYLKENLLDRFPGTVTEAQAMTWIAGPGIPADAVLPETDAYAAVEAARAAWLSGDVAAKKLDTRAWGTRQWLEFLDGMPATLTAARMADLDQGQDLARSANAEILGDWLLLVARNRYQPDFERLEEYLQSVGRRGLIVPLYAELMKTPAGAAQAKRVYKRARPGYHPQTAASVDPIVNPASDASEPTDE